MSLPFKVTSIVPPNDISSNANDTFPTEEDCLESLNLASSCSSPIAIASMAVSSTFLSLRTEIIFSIETTLPVILISSLTHGKVAESGTDLGIHSGKIP